VTHDVLQLFLETCEAWLCDGYSLDARYLAELRDGKYRIWDATVGLNPLPVPTDTILEMVLPNLIVGQVVRPSESKNALVQIISEVSKGVLDLDGNRMVLSSEEFPYRYHSDMLDRDRWFSEGHLQVVGSPSMVPEPEILARLDNALRASTPPFDGLSDIATWLGLKGTMSSSDLPTITVRINPPVDILLDRSRLSNDQLSLTIHSHPHFDVSSVGLAVRSLPSRGLSGRVQVADQIKWGAVQEGRRQGLAEVTLENADYALAMLLIGGTAIRRHWFSDPDRAPNARLVAVQQFDRELRMIRHALFESPDPSRFETGVAALLFLLGFAPAVQLETDSPDIVVTTPRGQILIVECTTRVADVARKVGKLIDRRGALIRGLQSSGHPAEVATALVCRLPKDQIAAHEETMRAHSTILVTGEDLLSGLDRARLPTDPDFLLSQMRST
jgi:hypothetical protein